MPDTCLLLVGAGHMGRALLKGWVAGKRTPIVAVEPHPSPELRKLATRHRIFIARDIDQVDGLGIGACVVALKPQILKTAAPHLRPIAQTGVPMISIAAGIAIASLAKVWGPKARIVRAMPNTPGAIGRGITGLFAAKTVGGKERALAEQLLSALGDTVWVKREALIDSVTAVSASGPAYVFLFVEALAAAAEQEGFSRDVAMKLARATVAGSGALLDADPTAADVLRRAVTSPAGTTEAALKVLMAPGGLADLVARAVKAARIRAQELA